MTNVSKEWQRIIRTRYLKISLVNLFMNFRHKVNAHSQWQRYNDLNSWFPQFKRNYMIDVKSDRTIVVSESKGIVTTTLYTKKCFPGKKPNTFWRPKKFRCVRTWGEDLFNCSVGDFEIGTHVF